MKSLLFSAREYAFKIIRKEPDYTIEKAKRIFKDRFYLVQKFLNMESERNQTTKLRKNTSLLITSNQAIKAFGVQVKAEMEYIDMVQKNYSSFLKEPDMDEDMLTDIDKYVKYIETEIKPGYNQLLKEKNSLLTDVRTYKNAIADFEIKVNKLMEDMVAKANELMWDKYYNR